MAAFTAAMELAAVSDSENCSAAPALQNGLIAHTLGTDLGTGWLMSDGSIPSFPLELYDLILDLGSTPASGIAPEDLRSTRNENSGLRIIYRKNRVFFRSEPSRKISESPVWNI